MAVSGEPLTRARLAPAPDALVRFPDGRALPADGEEVDIDAWWMRRIADADVVIVAFDEPATPAAQPITQTRRSRGKRKETA